MKLSAVLGRWRSGVWTTFAFGLFLASACLLSACSPTYVLRAGYEEAKILWRRQLIETLLQNPTLDPETRTKLELVLAVRRFADERLHLRVGGSYETFAQVDANQILHVVTAAYRDRLVAYTWWFPIVGRVPYKGFFSEAAAGAEAADLEAEGLDTAVRPSTAFSTLGWFDDPLLSTLLRYDQVALADTVIHELLHNTAYPAGQAAFNESFANFVGHRGALLFFTERNDQARREQAQTAWDASLVFSDFMGRFAARLRAAYAVGVTADERTLLFTQAQAECRELALAGYYRRFTEEPLNNAVLLGYMMYTDRLQLFEDVLQQQGGNLPQTIDRIIAALHAHDGDAYDAVAAIAAANGTPH